MVVTQKALSVGSEEPPQQEGVLRIYGMRFCPYVRRVLLVLAAKNIPHEVVNIHLKSKPEWYLAKIPTGKVPLLVQDDKMIWESLIIADYLDEVGPGPKLWGDDPYLKARGKIALSFADKLGSHIHKLLGEKSAESFENALNDIDTVDAYLKEHKKPFFMGDKPGMADYMIWPIVQVFMAAWGTGIYKGKSLLCSKTRPAFTAWAQQLLEDPVSKKVTPGIDQWSTFAQSVIDGQANYDVGL